MVDGLRMLAVPLYLIYGNAFSTFVNVGCIIRPTSPGSEGVNCRGKRAGPSGWLVMPHRRTIRASPTESQYAHHQYSAGRSYRKGEPRRTFPLYGIVVGERFLPTVGFLRLLVAESVLSM